MVPRSLRHFFAEGSGVTLAEGWWVLWWLCQWMFLYQRLLEPGKRGRSQTVKFYVSAFKRKLSDKSDKKMTCCKK